MEPPEFPICTIRAPVPWKTAVYLSKNRLEEILMVNHPVLQALNVLWRELYYDLLVVDTKNFFRTQIPFHAEKVTEMIMGFCRIARDVSRVI